MTDLAKTDDDLMFQWISGLLPPLKAMSQPQSWEIGRDPDVFPDHTYIVERSLYRSRIDYRVRLYPIAPGRRFTADNSPYEMTVRCDFTGILTAPTKNPRMEVVFSNNLPTSDFINRVKKGLMRAKLAAQ